MTWTAARCATASDATTTNRSSTPNAGYREDREALAAVRRDGRAPADPRHDLEAFLALARVNDETRLKREELFIRFNPAVLELDGTALLERFAGPHTRTFAKLGKAYREDARAIKAARPDHKLGDNLVDDLTLLVLVQDRQRDAEARRKALQADWSDDAFGLEHDQLLQRFNSLYTADFQARHERYHADLEAVLACAHEATPEADVRGDARGAGRGAGAQSRDRRRACARRDRVRRLLRSAATPTPPPSDARSRSPSRRCGSPTATPISRAWASASRSARASIPNGPYG